jgi:alternate signal-mediated exported protein
MKNKKSLIGLVALLLVGAISGTFAYFTTTKTFENIFATENYKTTVSETFESPEDWAPGTTTEKVVNVTNECDVEVAVRVKLEQSWMNGNKELALTQTTDGTPWDVAVINFTNADKWELKDGYYYYKEVLEKNEATLPLFNSVTYNSKMTDELAGIVCTDEIVGNTTTQTCESGEGYAGATYTLKVTVETIQADASTSEWGYTAA